MALRSMRFVLSHQPHARSGLLPFPRVVTHAVCSGVRTFDVHLQPYHERKAKSTKRLAGRAFWTDSNQSRVTFVVLWRKVKGRMIVGETSRDRRATWDSVADRARAAF